MAGLAFGRSVLPQGDYSVLPLKEGICRHQMIVECGTNLIVFQNLLLTTHNGQFQISISTLRCAFHHCIMSIYLQNTKTQIYLSLNKSPLQMLLNEACWCLTEENGTGVCTSGSPVTLEDSNSSAWPFPAYPSCSAPRHNHWPLSKIMHASTTFWLHCSCLWNKSGIGQSSFQIKEPAQFIGSLVIVLTLCSWIWSQTLQPQHGQLLCHHWRSLLQMPVLQARAF